MTLSENMCDRQFFVLMTLAFMASEDAPPLTTHGVRARLHAATKGDAEAEKLWGFWKDEIGGLHSGPLDDDIAQLHQRGYLSIDNDEFLDSIFLTQKAQNAFLVFLASQVRIAATT